MIIVSHVDYVLAACRAGVIGAFPCGNPRAPDTLDAWLTTIRGAERQAQDAGQRFAPFCVNLLASRAIDPALRRARLATCRRHAVPLILTNLGDPRDEVTAVHDWGGLIFHDVTTEHFADKAIQAGVDGLMLVCGGAGGHAGTLNPFAFLRGVRRHFGGIILLAGGIADGAGIAAALTLGADLAVMGTRFIATAESGAQPAHKHMLIQASAADIRFTGALTGMPASFLAPSLRNAGLDPDNLAHDARPHAGQKPWRDIYSGGHSVALIQDIPTMSELVARLTGEFNAAAAPQHWRETLARHRS